MEPVVLAFASNERYFPGLYCAVASALSHLDAARKVDVKVLDGGISTTSKDRLKRLVDRFGNQVRLKFVPVDETVFRRTTLGPGESHMTYCRILLPHLLDVPRLIYLDCDVLVFRDLSPLFDLELSPGKALAAVPDSETLSLAEDCPTIAHAMGLPAEGAYFNCGVMLMNLDELRKQHFFERAVEFLNRKSAYRFWDQSAINFLSTGKSTRYPNIGIELRGALMRSKTMILPVSFTTRLRLRGLSKSQARPKYYSNALQPIGLPVNRRSPHSGDQCARDFGEMQSPHCERLLFQSRHCATG